MSLRRSDLFKRGERVGQQWLAWAGWGGGRPPEPERLDSRRGRALGASLFFGVGLGLLLAYFVDPRLGRRRRAYVSDKLAHASRVGGREVRKRERRLVNRSRGMMAHVRSLLRPRDVSDPVVHQRVRAALGRVCQHTSAIEVSVVEGMVTLSGPVLEREHKAVLHAATRILGTRAVEDCLERHLHPENVRGLEGSHARVEPPPVVPGRCADIMKTVLQTASEDDTLRQAAEKMALANVGFLPVCDADRRVVGTITDRDIVVRGVALGANADDRTVGDVMSRNVVACRPEDEMAVVEQFMAYYQVSRLVITNERDELRGVISLSDIAEREPAKRAARTMRAVAAREAPRAS